MNNDIDWALTHTENIFETQTKGLRVQRRSYTSSDGRTKTVELKDEGPFGHAFAVTPDNKVILIRQFRVGPDKYFYESPAGSLDKEGDPQTQVARELREETGYTSNELILLKMVYDGAYTTAQRYLFLAKNCVKTHDQELDDDEEIDIVQLTEFADVIQMIKNDEYLYPLLAYLAFEKLNVLRWK